MTALPPIAGALEGVLERADEVSIHGDLYYDLVLRSDEGDAVRLRAPSHACDRAPAPGHRVRVRMLMRQVVGVESRA